jgi:hypothetical protein
LDRPSCGSHCGRSLGGERKRRRSAADPSMGLS